MGFQLKTSINWKFEFNASPARNQANSTSSAALLTFTVEYHLTTYARIPALKKYFRPP
jgi:hypothetical protein